MAQQYRDRDDGGYQNQPQKQIAPLTEEEIRIAKEQYPAFSEPQIKLIYSEMGNNRNPEFLHKFLYICRTKNLDPLIGEVHAEIRFSKYEGAFRMTAITHIDAYRKIADLTGNYNGQRTEILTGSKGELIGARTTIYRKGCDHPFEHECFLTEYNANTGQWQSKPRTMIAKCSEAGCFRKAFPAALSGTYISEEMDRREVDEAEAPAYTVGTKKAAEAAAEPADKADTAKQPAQQETKPAPKQEEKQAEKPAAPTEQAKAEEAPPKATQQEVVKPQQSETDIAVIHILDRADPPPSGEMARRAISTYLKNYLGIGSKGKFLPEHKAAVEAALATLRNEVVTDKDSANRFMKDPASQGLYYGGGMAEMRAKFAELKWGPAVTDLATKAMEARQIKPTALLKMLHANNIFGKPDIDVTTFLRVYAIHEDAYLLSDIAGGMAGQMCAELKRFEKSVGMKIEEVPEAGVKHWLDSLESAEPTTDEAEPAESTDTEPIEDDDEIDSLFNRP